MRKLLFIGIVLFISSLLKAEIIWPTDDIFDLMIKVSPSNITYKRFDSSDSILPRDSLIVSNKLNELLNWQNDFVRFGKRNYAFEKGIYIEFDSALTYRKFLRSLLTIAQIFPDKNQILRIGKAQIFTNFYGYRFRTEYWATRPLIQIKNDLVAIRLINFKNWKYLRYPEMSNILLDSLFGLNFDSCFNKRDIGYGKAMKDDKLLRMTANPDIKLLRIIEFLNKIDNPYRFIFRFYALDDLSLKKTINLDSLCKNQKGV